MAARPLALVLTLLGTSAVAALRVPLHASLHAASSSRCRVGTPTAAEDGAGDEERLLSTDSPEYFEGMLTSPLDARSDENLDNITPNLKLVAGATAIIFALCAAFVLGNPPPPASFVSP